MKEKVYYKVVSVYSGDRLSSCVTRSVRYVPGERTQAPFGPLFVFATLGAAQAFITDYNHKHKQIWECEVGNPRPVKAILFSMLTESRIEHFWENPETHGLFSYGAPAGTIIADWVELTRKVE